MTAQQYRETVYPEIIRRYSYTDGLLAIGKTADRISVIRLCVPTKDNPDSPWNPEYCFLWFRDSLIYEGDLTNAGVISRMCNKYKICTFVYTTVSRIECSNKGSMVRLCSDDERHACDKKCAFKVSDNAMLEGRIYG